MFIIFPLTIIGILTYFATCFVHKLLWEDRNNLEDFKVYQANESNQEEIEKIKKINLK